MMALCPICKKNPVEAAFRPFCSRRCADVDLGRWFTGAYVIPDSVDEATSDPLADREDDD
ncbi:DNA gyrase inhibitor YacG [Rhizobium sp. CRIBSB]|nr:DNA gyrase inhibitor YacG [Rhizobium sp. CRIBSB]